MLARYRGLWVVIISMLLVAPMSLARAHNEPNKKCETLLDRDQNLTAIDAYSQAIRSELGIYSNPFWGYTQPTDILNLWHELQESFPLLYTARVAVENLYKPDVDAKAPSIDEMVSNTLAATEYVMQNPSASTREKQAALMTLRRVRDLLTYQERSESDDAKKSEAPQPPAKPKQPPSPPSPPPPPRFPEVGEQYNAHNKDTAGEGGGDQTKTTVASVLIKGVAYFKSIHYHIIDGVNNRWSTARVFSSPTKRSVIGTVTLTLFPFNKLGSKIRILLPQGYIPRSDAANVTKDESDNYWVEANDPETKVDLVPLGSALQPLSPEEVSIYTGHTGLTLNDYPDHLRIMIEDLKLAYRSEQKQNMGRYSGAEGHLALAADIEDYIKTTFKYRVDADPAAPLPKILADGAFQCDSAATLLASILRNEFGIAARIVGGFPGETDVRKPGTSVVTSPPQGHAWIEVPDSRGNWHVFDATPTEKDRDTDDEGGDPNYKPNKKPQGSDEQNKDDKEKDGSADGDESVEKLSEKIAKWKQAKDLERAQALEAAKELKEQQDNVDEVDEVDSDAPTTQKNTAKNKRTSKPKSTDDDADLTPAQRELLKGMVWWATNPALTNETRLQRISYLRGSLDSSRKGVATPKSFSFALKARLSEVANFIVDHTQTPLDRLGNITHSAAGKDLSQTLLEINEVYADIKSVLKYAPSDAQASYRGVLAAIDQLKQVLQSIRHKDSKDIQTTIEFYRSLPGNISRDAMEVMFPGLSQSLGATAQTLAVAQALQKGELNDYRLMSILGPHTNFVVRPFSRPLSSERKTWSRTNQMTRGRPDLLVTTDPRDKGQFIKMNPHLSDREAIQQGQMYILARRKVVRVPEGFSSVEPEKVTIIGYDTSGSMIGDPLHFQSQYIAALVDRALSDVGENGSVRHRVYLLGFADDVHTEIEVTSAKQALDVVLHTDKKLNSKSGGTKIESVLMRSAEIIAKANAEGDKAMARATVILASDGGDDIKNPSEIKEALRAAAMRDGVRADVLMAFVAINGTNEILKQMALSSTELGADQGLYLEWSPEDIDKVLTDAQTTQPPKSDFWTTSSYQELSSSIKYAFQNVTTAAVMASNRAHSNISSLSKLNAAQNFADRIKRLPPQIDIEKTADDQDLRVGSQSANIRSLRFVINALSLPMTKRDKAEVFAGLVERWQQICPGSLNSPDAYEYAHMTHIMRWLVVDD